MDTLLKLVQTANAYLSDYILIVMLVGCGLYYSIRTRFVQVRCLGEGMRRVFGGFSLRGGKQSGGISSFQALATAVAAARQAAKPGDVVVLSPACAAFDHFKNFMERGQVFKKLVQEL